MTFLFWMLTPASDMKSLRRASNLLGARITIKHQLRALILFQTHHTYEKRGWGQRTKQEWGQFPGGHAYPRQMQLPRTSRAALGPGNSSELPPSKVEVGFQPTSLACIRGRLANLM